jgi:hypothetical protein
LGGGSQSGLGILRGGAGVWLSLKRSSSSYDLSKLSRDLFRVEREGFEGGGIKFRPSPRKLSSEGVSVWVDRLWTERLVILFSSWVGVILPKSRSL